MPPVNFFVSREGARPQGLPGDRVDFYELGLIHNVRKGQVLAEAYDEPHFDPKDFPAGENTYVPEDNPRVLLAAADGHAFWKDGKIHVSPIYVVSGDVDLSTGNLHFVGRLVVKGTVRASFVVEAKEALIEGDVEGRVFTRGNLEVLGGIVSGKRRVICGGDLRASYIMSSQVEAKGKVEVEKFIRESEVKAGETVRVMGNPGLILGGLIQARLGVEARVMGSGMSVRTKVVAGVDPFLERLVEVKLKEIDAQRQELEKAIADPEVPFEEKFDLEHTLVELDFYRSMLEEGLYEAEDDAFIRIHEKAFQGVTLAIGRHSLRLEDDLGGPINFTLKGGKIVP